jgi:hypothetical protein
MLTSSGRTPAASWVLDDEVSRIVRVKARRLSRTSGFSRSDRPDLEQELNLHLLLKAHLFDSSKAQAATFASRLVDNKARSIIRHARAQRRSYLRNAQSLDESMVDGVVPMTSILDEEAARRHTGQRAPSEAELTQLRLDMAEANSTLPTEMRMMAALLSHVPQFAAGEVLGLSRRQAAKCIAALRALYERRGLSA